MKKLLFVSIFILIASSNAFAKCTRLSNYIPITNPATQLKGKKYFSNGIYWAKRPGDNTCYKGNSYQGKFRLFAKCSNVKCGGL